MRDYALGPKPFTTTVMIATLFATAISAHKTIGNVGKSYDMGMMFMATMFLIPIGWFVMARLLSFNLAFFHKKQFLTMGDIMEHWYGPLGRNITSLCAIFFTLGITAASSKATGKLLHYFFGISEFWGMVTALGIVTLYSTFGGLRAVAMTDVFQFLIFFIALPIACAIGYNDVGGYKNILKSLPASHLTLNLKDIYLFVGIAVFSIMPNADIPFIQRALASKDSPQLKKAFSTVAILMFPLFLIVGLIGLITYIKAPGLQTDAVLYHFTKHYLPAGVVGLMIVGLLAIIMSTQDSFLNTTSVLISKDVCKQIWPALDDKRQLIIARFSCAALSIVSIALVYSRDNIIDLIWFVTNFWDPLVVVPLLASLVGLRINKKLFFIVPIVTLTAEFITKQIVGAFDTRSFAVGVIASMITLFILSRASRKKAVIYGLLKISGYFKQRYSPDPLEIYKFSLLTIFGFFASVFFNPLVGIFTQDSVFYLNGIGAALCLVLLLKDLWLPHHNQEKILLWFWYLILFFCLPFISMYTLVRSEYYFSWLINFVLVNALLYLIVRNPLIFFNILLSGMFCGFICGSLLNFYAPAYPAPPYSPLDVKFASYSCAFFLVRIALVLHNRTFIEKHLYSLIEKKVAERTKELYAALEVKNEFLDNVSHEIRTPVHNITNITTMLYENWNKTPERGKLELVEMLHKCNARLLSLCSNLLDLSKLRAGNEVDIKKYEIRSLINESVAEYKVHKDLISLKISPAIPKFVYCDQEKILQVMRNFIDNAIRYGKETPIDIVVTTKDDDLVFAVSDRGVGIPSTELQTIFNPFEQSSLTKTKAGGTGLGLAICKKIVEYHKGRIWAENNDEAGSTFYFTLPMRR